MKRLCCVVICTLGIAGCLRSGEEYPPEALGPTERGTVRGRFLDETGRPLSAANVQVKRNHQPFREVTTLADGTFSFEVTGSEVLREEDHFVFTPFEVVLPVSGVYAEQRFSVTGKNLELPTLQRWNAMLMQEELGMGRLKLSWEPLPSPISRPDTTRFELTSDIVKLGEGEERAIELTPFWREDFGWNGELTATRTFATAREVQVLPVTFLKGSRAALSRVATCSYPGATSPCRLTDGFVEPIQFDPQPTQIQVTLGQATTVERVLLRGLLISGSSAPRLQIEGSVDGTSWSILWDSENRPLELATDGVKFSKPALVSHLRLSTGQEQSGNAFEALGEISVF